MIAVDLIASLTDEHKTLVLRYIGEAERFSLAEWVTLFEAFTILSDSTAQLQGEILTFQAFYDRFVDQVHSDTCIADLYAATDVPAQAPAIQASYARQIYQQLRREPFICGYACNRMPAGLLSDLVGVFCRGYAFELEICRDLDVAGIHFTSHDLRVREQRFSRCDLTVLGLIGDIKNMTYFLYVGRSFPLTCYFYITRLYNTATGATFASCVLTDRGMASPQRRYRQWQSGAGRTIAPSCRRHLFGYALVVMDCMFWKQEGVTTTASRRPQTMTHDPLDERFEAYLPVTTTRSQVVSSFEILAEIERDERRRLLK